MPFCGFLLANVINLNQMRACAAVHRPQGVNEEEKNDYICYRHIRGINFSIDGR